MPRNVGYLALLLVIATLVSTYDVTRAAPAAEVAVVDVDAALAQPNLGHTSRMRLQLFQLVNQARAKNGLRPYRLDARLSASAGAHAEDMAHNGFCRHTGSDGSSSRDRMSRHGYPFNNWAGENIICSRWTPASAMRWWMASGPHRRNILHGSYTHIGIGYDPHGRYGPDWVLNFGAGASDTMTPHFAVVSELPFPGQPQPN